MLSRYYNSTRIPVIDFFDVFKTLEESSSWDTQQKRDSIDQSGIKIELPGVKPEDVEVTVEGKTLRVTGKSRHGKEFKYTYALRSGVDDSAITAKFQDGLLDINLPKKQEESIRKIKIS